MSSRVAVQIVGLIAALGLAACAPGVAPTQRAEPGAAAPAPPQPTIVLVSRGDPASLATKAFATNAGSFGLTRVFNATLSFKDEREAPNPYLAEALPQLNTDSWTVTPDGHMVTTWKLRSNLTWHDGTPLTSEDFAFSYRVYSKADLGAASSTPIRQMEAVEAPDPRTIVIRWKQLYADAVVENGGFYPLPRHLLQQPLDTQEPAGFMSNSFWVSNYVGAGPFKVTEYAPGDHLDALAFEGHALGRPKLDKIRIRPITDAHTAVANLLTGAVHFVDAFVMSPTDGIALEQEWGRKDGEVMWSPTTHRSAIVQWRPEFAEPKSLSDVRVRRALAHGFDVPSVVETLNYGKGLQTPTVTAPSVAYYAEIEKLIRKYPYDARLVAQNMEPAGFMKGADGMFVDAAGTKFSVEVSSVGDDKNIQETAFFVDSLIRTGLGAKQHVFPPEQTSDAMGRALRPGLSIKGGSGGLNAFISTEAAAPNNRWNGQNRSGYVNPEYDRIYDQFTNTLDERQRVAFLAQMEKILTEDVAAVMLFFQSQPTAHLLALKGPQNTASPGAGGGVLRIHEWKWEP